MLKGAPPLDTNSTPVYNSVLEPNVGITVPIDVTDNAVMSSSRVGSPTSISNLLEMALGPQQINDGNKETGEIPSFAGKFNWQQNIIKTPKLFSS